MSKNLQILGKHGEELIEKYLEQKKFTILAKNYSCKYGEIDLIAQNSNIIAFIEVKLRQNPLFYISEIIVPSKQKKIIKTALWYVAKNRLSDYILRFDVALIERIADDYNISYIPNAFTKCQ